MRENTLAFASRLLDPEPYQPPQSETTRRKWDLEWHSSAAFVCVIFLTWSGLFLLRATSLSRKACLKTHSAFPTSLGPSEWTFMSHNLHRIVSYLSNGSTGQSQAEPTSCFSNRAYALWDRGEVFCCFVFPVVISLGQVLVMFLKLFEPQCLRL